MKKILLLAILSTFALATQAQTDIFGKWKTIDDETGKPKSIVEIYKKDGKAYGKIIKLYRTADEDQDPICEECTGGKKNQKIIGMEIITALEQDGSDWEDGTILDPKNGKIYDCEIWRDGSELKVRGYIAFLYRTQTWQKAD